MSRGDQGSDLVQISTRETEEFVPLRDGVVSWVRQDDDVKAGICVYKVAESEGRHEIAFDHSETVLVLDGRIRLEITGGPSLELGAGEAASFKQGTTGEWSLVEDTRLFFVST